MWQQNYGTHINSVLSSSIAAVNSSPYELKPSNTSPVCGWATSTRIQTFPFSFSGAEIYQFEIARDAAEAKPCTDSGLIRG